MTTLTLSANADGRVILDDKTHHVFIKTVEAEPVMSTSDTPVVLFSAWRVARPKIDESKFDHRRGNGFFMDAPDFRKLCAEQRPEEDLPEWAKEAAA